MDFLIRVVVNAVAIWIATLIVPGVTVSGDSNANTALTLLGVGAIFGLVNALIKPVVKVLAFPLYLLTLGLMALVVNAAMLMLASWLSGKVGLSFHIDDFFWSGVLAAIVVALATMVINAVLPDRD